MQCKTMILKLLLIFLEYLLVNGKVPKKITRDLATAPFVYLRWTNYVSRLKFLSTPWVSRYSPNFGYEPYWNYGDWILEDFASKYKLKTTTVPLVCGQECGEMYRDIGKVCVLKPYESGFIGYSCWHSWVPSCNGRTVDSQPYQTLNTYCEFLISKCWNEQSIFATQSSNLIFLHLGPCMPMTTSADGRQEGVFQYLDSRNEDGSDNPPGQRIVHYLYELYMRQMSQGLRPPMNISTTKTWLGWIMGGMGMG